MQLQGDWSRWEKPGDIATHPKYIAGTGNKNAHKTSSRFLEDGSYLRLRSLSIGYSLPESLLKRAHIQAVRLSVSGENLVTFTSFSGIDPETSDRGEIGTKYPYARKLLAGIQVTFND